MTNKHGSTAKSRDFNAIAEENERLKNEVALLKAPKDASGKVIKPGSVIRRTDDYSQRGVVVRIIKEDAPSNILTGSPGDINVMTSPGCTTVSSQHSKWEHIPHDDQNYMERFHAWRYRDCRDEPENTEFFIDCVMSLFPYPDIHDDHPDDMGSLMERLAKELTKPENRRVSRK